MDEYIRKHRGRYTREAITAELEEAGHARADIDSAWRRIDLEPPPAESDRLGRYAWVIYWLGAALIALNAAFGIASGGIGFITFGVGWLVAYLALAYFPIRALSRARMSNLATSIGLVIAAPVIVLLIGGGICLGTVALLVSQFGG
jgi:hypothetical protein